MNYVLRILTLAFLVVSTFMICGCASVQYMPTSLETRARSELTQIHVSSAGDAHLESIDGKTVESHPSAGVFVAPGKHKVTFSMQYLSKKFYPAEMVFQHTTPGAIARSLLIGEYSMEVDAPAGKRIMFIRKADPDFKKTLSDYFKVEIKEQIPVE